MARHAAEFLFRLTHELLVFDKQKIIVSLSSPEPGSHMLSPWTVSINIAMQEEVDKLVNTRVFTHPPFSQTMVVVGARYVPGIP